MWKAQNEIDNADVAGQVMRIVEALEDVDDVNDVYHNFEMTEEAAAKIEAE